MKRCPFCAEEIQDAAIVCKHCGRDLATSKSDRVVTVQRAWSPGVAAVLSLIIPGAGQIYKGNVGTGLMWLFGTAVGYVAFILLGVILHLVCIVNAASGDPTATSPPSATPEPDVSDAKLLGFSDQAWIWIGVAVVVAIFAVGIWFSR